jgi:hypothetical protein
VACCMRICRLQGLCHWQTCHFATSANTTDH